MTGLAVPADLIFISELQQRAHSPQVLPDGSASRAAGSFNRKPCCTHPEFLDGH